MTSRLFTCVSIHTTVLAVKRAKVRQFPGGRRRDAYVISVLIVWAAIFAVGYVRTGSTPGHPLLDVLGGFLLGMLSMYIAMRIYPPKRKAPHT